MHLRAQRLELLLVRNAEMLLLVDDQQGQVLERDALAEQRVGADHDIDAAVGQAGFDFAQLRVGHQPRRLRDIDRKSTEALGKGLEVLTGEQRRRHHDRDLLAADCRQKGRAQRHLGLAESDVAADEPVHRTP